MSARNAPDCADDEVFVTIRLFSTLFRMSVPSRAKQEWLCSIVVSQKIMAFSVRFLNLLCEKQRAAVRQQLGYLCPLWR
jgi:hypothetical protein